MTRKDQIKEAIKILGSRFKDHKVKWLIGASGSLLIHGLDITPNDIDVIVDPKSYDEVKTILKDLLTGETKFDRDHLQTPFKLNNVDGELLTHEIDEKLLQIINLGGVEIFVYPLQVEYDFYKKRTDKIEANKEKIKLIEKALSHSVKI